MKKALVELEDYRKEFYCVDFMSYEAHKVFTLFDLARQESQEIIDKENQRFSSIPVKM